MSIFQQKQEFKQYCRLHIFDNHKIPRDARGKLLYTMMHNITPDSSATNMVRISCVSVPKNVDWDSPKTYGFFSSPIIKHFIRIPVKGYTLERIPLSQSLKN